MMIPVVVKSQFKFESDNAWRDTSMFNSTILVDEEKIDELETVTVCNDFETLCANVDDEKIRNAYTYTTRFRHCKKVSLSEIDTDTEILVSAKNFEPVSFRTHYERINFTVCQLANSLSADDFKKYMAERNN